MNQAAKNPREGYRGNFVPRCPLCPPFRTQTATRCHTCRHRRRGAPSTCTNPRKAPSMTQNPHEPKPLRPPLAPGAKIHPPVERRSRPRHRAPSVESSIAGCTIRWAGAGGTAPYTARTAKPRRRQEGAPSARRCPTSRPSPSSGRQAHQSTGDLRRAGYARRARRHH